MKKNIADKITFSRFFFGILMLLSIYFSSLSFFLFFYVVAIITDVLDGFFARKLKIESVFGKKLDILADNFILFCIIIGIYFFKRDFFLKSIFYFIMIFLYYIIIQFVSFLKTKKLIFMRTYAANLTAAVFPFIVFFILVFESKVSVLIYSILMIYSLTEKLFLQILKKNKSIFNAKDFKKTVLFFLIFSILSSALFLYFQESKIQDSKVCFGEKFINVEVMDTPEKRSLGLMYRQRLTEEEGMLFIFENPLVTSFWMKNMQFSIDIIFIDENKTIVHIEKNVPPCYENPCPLYSSVYEIKYVVEVVAGFSDTYNIKKGEKIKIN